MVVIGLGSPFLADDGVGPRVVRELARQGLPGARLVEAHAGGLLLVEELKGASRAVIVDALADERRVPGEVLVSGVDRATHNASCSHDCDLPQALALGRAMGLPLPADAEILLVAVVARDLNTFSETLSPAVEAAVPRACAEVRAWLAGEEGKPQAEAA
ncbi:MAG: hydrogenase maturation protease [Deltaproteobacteria bacterium]|nr:hydrogenase maturation protease [Deltaproteobacteria bacterium]